MIGVMITDKREWDEFLKLYNISKEYLEDYPYGEFYVTKFQKNDVIFFRCPTRKVSVSGATQYIIDKYEIEKLVLIGTCVAVEDFDYGEIVIPDRVVEYDLTIRELEPLVNDKIIIELDNRDIDADYSSGLIGTSEKALVLWKDYLKLKEETEICASDMESAAVAKVCKINNIELVIIKGVTDKVMEGANGIDEQVEVFEENLPIVIKDILENYLTEVIK